MCLGRYKSCFIILRSSIVVPEVNYGCAAYTTVARLVTTKTSCSKRFNNNQLGLRELGDSFDNMDRTAVFVD